MDPFVMNGIFWKVKRVGPSSKTLIDRTGKSCVATTDPYTRTIYLSEELEGEFLKTVLLHELGHCAMFSYGLLDDVRRFSKPEDYIYAEEWICNFVADYGKNIFDHAKDILDDEEDIWSMIAQGIERIVYNG